MRSRSSLCFVLLWSASFVACGGNGSSGPDQDPPPGDEDVLLPALLVKQGETEIHQDDHFDFGSTVVETVDDVVFVIENVGQADLVLTGNTPVTVENWSSSAFSIVTQPTSPLTPGETSSFTIRFAPNEIAAAEAGVSIANNATGNIPFAFQLDGEGTEVPGPQIAVRDYESETFFANGDAIDLGSTFATDVSRTYRIFNLGTEDLVLTGTPRVELSGTDAALFSVTAQPDSPITPDNSSVFALRFTPDQSLGTKTATLTIASNDADLNPFTLEVSCRSVAPEIDVEQGDTTIAHGDVYDFGTPVVADTADVTFSIGNLGDHPLTLGDASVTGTDASMFTVLDSLAGTSLEPTGSTTLTVRLVPTTHGAVSATLSVPNNDPDESPYEIQLSADVTAWSGVQTIDASNIAGMATSLAVDGDYVYVTYLSYEQPTDRSILIARSSDGGATWPAEDIRVVEADVNVDYYTSLAVWGSNLYVAYRNASGQLLFAKSTDRGDTWPSNAKRTVDASDLTGVDPSIGVSQDNIYISYRQVIPVNFSFDDDLKLAKSTDGGDTWSSLITVDSEGNTGHSSSIYVYGTIVYIAYYDATTPALKLAKSASSGTNWTTQVIDARSATNPDIAVNSSTVYVAYRLVGVDDLYVAKSLDYGDTWTATNRKAVETSGYVGMHPSIGCSGSDIYVSYYDQTAKDLLLAHSGDANGTWSYDIDIDTGDEVGDYSSMAVVGSTLYISYYDETNGDLKFAKSIDGGTTW